MAYDALLADRVRDFLSNKSKLGIVEKKMFRGLAFMVNDKMCVNISGDNLMCRFDPALTSSLAAKPGYLPMIMKGKELAGYCYVEPAGIRNRKDFEFWVGLCLDFNKHAKASAKQKR